MTDPPANQSTDRRPTSQQTDMRVYMEVTQPKIVGYLHKYLDRLVLLTQLCFSNQINALFYYGGL